MNSFFQNQQKNWKRNRLKFLIQGSQNGAWGSEAGDDEVDVLCVRVAEFDWETLSLKYNNPTYRSFNKKQVEKLLLLPGDIVIEKSGAGTPLSIAHACKVGHVREGAISVVAVQNI